MKKFVTILIIIIITFLLALGVYYWFSAREEGTVIDGDNTETSIIQRFNPFNRSSVNTTTDNTIPETIIEDQIQTNDDDTVIPILRKISEEPIGGYIASTTASSTIVRYIDRGTGHIYEAKDDTNIIEKLSNTTIPRVYESYWNNTADASIMRYMKEGTSVITNLYGEINLSSKTASTTDRTPYETNGRIISSNIKELAISPKGDRVFTFNIEDGAGIGYISNMDGSKNMKIWDTPLTLMNVDWPEENTLIATTKATGASYGYSYFINAKTGVSNKILGGIVGLSTKASGDAENVLFSSGNNQNTISTFVYNKKDNNSKSIIFKTLAEKCVWSKISKNEIYCAVPSEFPTGMYPDDWYKGNVSLIDKIWHLNIDTGEVHLIADLFDLSKKFIDVVDMRLDPEENFLYFVNKNDLTLWSLDLNR